MYIPITVTEFKFLNSNPPKGLLMLQVFLHCRQRRLRPVRRLGSSWVAVKVGLGLIVPLKWIEHGAYGDLSIIYPKPYSIYLRGTIGLPRVPGQR